MTLCALAWVLPTAAAAQRSILVETRSSSTPNGKPAYALAINDRIVAQLAKESRIDGAERPPQRAVALAAALITEAFRSGRAELTLHPDTDGRGQVLRLNGRELLVASDAESKAWGTTPSELATTWRQNIDNAWLIERESPPVSAARDARPVPTPQRPQPSPMVNQDGSLLEDRTSETTGATRLRPNEPPAPRRNVVRQGEVPAQRGPSRATSPPQLVRMESLPSPARYTAQLTGATPSKEHLDFVIQQTLKASAALPWSARIVWTPVDEKFTIPKLDTGAEVKLPLTYKVNGMGDPVRADVTLRNAKLNLPRESLTFFSNAPENVRRPQLLYYAELPAAVAGRLVWHHQSHYAAELQFIARVVNTSDRDAAIHVTPGQWGANINTFLVGYRSAQDFWRNYRSGSGFVQLVPAGGQAFILSQPLPKGYTSSGYYKVTNLTDVPLRLETLALEPGAGLPSGPWPSTEGATGGVFPAPYHIEQRTYAARGADTPWLYLRLGEASPYSYVCDAEHYGSYGVTHTYHVEMRNESGGPALVYLVLRGSAGEVKGQFYIDGEYFTTPLVAGGEEYLLKEIPLKAGAVTKVRIDAIALNGSFYPASIIVRETRQP